MPPEHDMSTIPPASGQLGSPFFTELPPEIRLKVYSWVFLGSVVEAESYHGDEARRFCFDVITKHHKPILRTCRDIYNEARPIYISETELDMSMAIPIPHLRDVARALSTFARAHIRHISVDVPDNDHEVGDLLEFVDGFPVLQLCT